MVNSCFLFTILKKLVVHVIQQISQQYQAYIQDIKAAAKFNLSLIPYR